MFIVSALGFEHSTAWKSFRIFWLMYRSAISLPTVCLPTYIALYVHVLSYMYMVHYVYVHMFVHNCISRCRHELFIWCAHAQPESREKKNKKQKKTWKRKYKQRTKTNTKKSTINNKKIESTPQCVLTQNGPCPVAQMNCIFSSLLLRTRTNMGNVGREYWMFQVGEGGRWITHLISLSNRVQHLQQHLHNTAPLQRF